MSRRARWLRIATSMGASLLLQARALVVSVVVFRLFTDPAELWGTVNNVTAVVTLLLLPAKFGLEFTAVQFVSKFREHEPGAALEALRWSTVLRVVFTLVVGLPMLLFPEVVGAWTGLGDVPHLVQIGGVLLLSTSLYEFTAYLLSGLDDFPGMMTARAVFTVVNIGAIAAIAVWGGTDAAGPVVMAQALGGVAAIGVASALLVRRSAGLRAAAAQAGSASAADGVAAGEHGAGSASAADGVAAGEHGAAASEPVSSAPTVSEVPGLGRDEAPPQGVPMVGALLRFALPMTLLSAAGQIFQYVDRVLLPVLADRAALGSYAVANSVVSAALFGTYAFRNVARTRLPGLLRHDPEEARRVLLATYRAVFAVSVWIAAGAATVAPDLLRLIYGEASEDAASMLRWFVPWVLVGAHASLSATALVAADRPRTYAVLMGILSLLNVGLNLAFIPWLGGHGAIAATTVSNVPLAIWAYREVSVAYGGDLWSRAELRRALPTVGRMGAVGVAAAAVGWGLTGPSWLAAVGGGLAVSAVFAAGLWASGDLAAIRRAM